MDLKTPIRNVSRVYKMYASRLEKLGIQTLEDFLYHFPFRYEDYSLLSKINQVQAGEVVTIQGEVLEIKNEYTKRFKKLQKAKVDDGTGEIEIIWFNQPFLIKYIQEGNKISLSGRVSQYGHKIVLESPDYEILTGDKTIHTGRLVPVYPETNGISSKWLRRQIYKILQEYKHKLFEYLPSSIIETNDDLINFIDAIEQIHFPKSIKMVTIARTRLAFDELFLIQLAALERKKEWGRNLTSKPFSISKFKDKIEEFWQKLPFELTNAQKKAVKEIFQDLAGKKPMNRLLEGDVGSGKTVVSAIAMYLAYLNGYQSVLMAPTEILAQQHYQTIHNLLSPFGIKVDLQTSSSKYYVESIKKKKEKLHNTNYIIQATDVLVGTHALLSGKLNFDKLGLVVIDEQQRFGVEQRAILRKKGRNPHLLTMTATPIPRTVALTLYGDLDLSYLDEMPIGRKKVKTWLVQEEKRESAYKWILSQLSSFNSQLFIICPFIEESENIQTVKAATKEYERLKNKVFEGFKLGLLHGRLKSKEKEKVLHDFRNRKFEILVATPVVEVGIDIPNATIIVIEGAERFGLAQLHQLRGRVGRGDKQSYCLLFTQAKSEQVIKRLKSLETIHDGARLAEFDLQLRGPGQIYGTMQHGKLMLKIASFSDFPLIERTKKEGEKIFPKLKEYPKLLEKLKAISIQNVSPD